MAVFLARTRVADSISYDNNRYGMLRHVNEMIGFWWSVYQMIFKWSCNNFCLFKSET